jgi:hypothetical protein
METKQSIELTIQEQLPARPRRGGGPRTAIGKERSKRNAVKYGIFAKEVLLPNEQKTEFGALLEGLRNDRLPQGTLENLLVEKLASLFWRYKRMLGAERGEIQLEETMHSLDEDTRECREAAELLDSEEGRTAPLILRHDNRVVVARCVEMLRALKDMVEVRGSEPKFDLDILKRVYGDLAIFTQTVPSIVMYGLWAYEYSRGDHQRPETLAHLAEAKAKFLIALDKEISEYKSWLLQNEETSILREARESVCRQVPVPQKLDRLLRYSASLERDIDRTLNQLERVQRIRRGQPAPPTLNVNVS